MDSFFEEWWRGNIVSRRPSVGYNTKEERQDNVFKGISDYEVYYKNELIGELRSGSYNPMFKQAIGIAMIKKPYFKPSQEFKVNINGKNVSGKVCDLPFI